MHVHGNTPEEVLLNCDRTRSKEARYALQNLLWEPLRVHRLSLSKNCAWAQEKDVLIAQESKKILLGNIYWQCAICEKIFRNEHFLDKHLARKHSTVRHEEGKVCLADYCGSNIPCMPLSQSPFPSVSTKLLSSESIFHPYEMQELARPQFCDDEHKRHLLLQSCGEMLKNCVQRPSNPMKIGEVNGLVDQLKRDICERALRIECVPRNEVWSAFGNPNHALLARTYTGSRHQTLWMMFSFFVILLMVCPCIRARPLRRKPHIRMPRRKKEVVVESRKKL